MAALGVGGLLFATRIAHAAGFSVSDCSTYGTSIQTGTLAKALADATASADNSDTITFACDTSGSGLVFPASYAVAKGLTLDATGHSVAFNGNGATRFFTVSATGALTLIHLTLTHGFGDTPGGALQITGGAVAITNSTFTDNVDNDPTNFLLRGGGAIAVLGGLLHVTSSTFAHNIAARLVCDCLPPIAEGGAILLQGSVSAPATATVDGSSFSDNAAEGGPHGGWGGAIYAESAPATPATPDMMKLTISGSTFTHNLGTGLGEGGALGTVRATVSVNGSVFSDNGPEISTDEVLGGGIGSSDSNLTITTSTFAHNVDSAVNVGTKDSITLITQSAFVSNVSRAAGGGLVVAGSATVTNSTFSGNSSTCNNCDPAFPQGGGAIFNSGNLILNNDTISGNSIGGTLRGSNIFNDGDQFRVGAITYRNTIVANGSGDANCFYAPSSLVTDGGYNLDSGTNCGFSSASHSLNNTDPKLAALASNGGPTQTMALQLGSSAIDAANAGVCAAAPVSGIDQRGIVRPQGPGCDIGAFELVPTATTATTITSSAGEVACGQRVTFTAHVTSANGTPVGSVTFEDGATTLGAGTLNSGFASFSIGSLETGAHSVRAVYPAEHGFLGSASSAVTMIVGACEGGGGSGLDPNAPTTNHPLYETPTATLAPVSTATPSVSENPASGGPVSLALAGSGALLLLLLAGGGFFYLRRRNGGAVL
jgi:hypothetical protein